MGKIIYREGDILEAPENIVIQGNNASGGYASGLAGQIAKRFPEAKKSYMQKYNTEGWTVGEVQPIIINTARTIINCATQKYYGRDGICYVDYDSFYKVFTLVATYVEFRGFRSFGSPKIGTGLGGGSWEFIESIAEMVLRHRPVDMIVYTLPDSS